MKIIVSQQNKKLLVVFKSGEVVDKYAVDKADGFLLCIDKFVKKRKMEIVSLREISRREKSLKKAGLEFVGTGILTERIVRAIMAGLSF